MDPLPISGTKNSISAASASLGSVLFDLLGKFQELLRVQE